MTRKLINKTFRPDELSIDPAYQRLIVPKQVKRIVDNYDEVAFGRILVGVRRDSSAWVVDGQQRLRAAITLGFKSVPCVMFESEGRADEAAMFVKYNADRAGVQPMDIFRAAVQAGDKDMVALLACVESCGFTIGRGGSTPYVIQCVNQLISVWRQGGSGLIREVLGIIKETWDDEREATHNLVITGLSSFCGQFTGRYDRVRLIKCLKSTGPLDLQRYTKDSIRITGSHSAQLAFASAVAGIYNKKLRTGRLEIQDKHAPSE